MKIFCFLLLFIPVSLTAQSFWVQDTVVITYEKEHSQNIKEKRWIYECNEKGNRTETIYQEMEKNDTILRNKWKTNYFYDEKDNLVLNTFYDWKDSSFVVKGQSVFIKNKKRTEELYQRWKDTTWHNSQKDIYTYNRKGKLKNHLMSYNSGDTLWEKRHEDSRSYFFNKTKITIRPSFNYKNKWVHIYTFNKHKSLKKFIAKKYTYHSINHVDDSGNRYRYYRPRSVEKHKETMEYNKNNLRSLVNENNYKKEFYNYDTNNNVVEKIIQYGNDTLCQKYTYQYDSENNRISILVQKGKNLEWKNMYHFIYKYENNNAVFGECKVWENDQWVNGNGEVEIVYNNGKSFFAKPDYKGYHQFRGSYKEIKINKE